MNIDYFILTLEINKEIKELKESGLSQDEIEGYIEFFMDNWLESIEDKADTGVSNVRH